MPKPAKGTIEATPPTQKRMELWLREAAFLLVVPFTIYLLCCFWSYHPDDPSWSHANTGAAAQNYGGLTGAWIADIGFYFLGVGAYWIPLVMLITGFRFAFARAKSASHAEAPLRFIAIAVLIASFSGLSHLYAGEASDLPAHAGGVLGELIGRAALVGIGELGATLLLIALFLTGITITTHLSWFWLMDKTGHAALTAVHMIGNAFAAMQSKQEDKQLREEREIVRKQEFSKQAKRDPIKIEPRPEQVEKSERAARELQIPLFSGLASGALPPLSLLDEPKQQTKSYSPETLTALSRQVELKLKDFRIDAQVVEVFPGPVVTRFELQPAAGIKGSQIASLDKDIARGLSVISVRVVDVIPGKSVIGLEIPNSNRETVYLSEILRSREYDKSASPLSLALGKDIGGKPAVVDLAKMPHLLVAGTTGAGKSVALNAMVLSLLYKASPNEVRMLMIDPKMLELSVYEGIPHLLAPVVTDMKDASNGLRWCVAEMERRYKLMATVGVRNLAGFNRKVKEAQDKGQPLLDPFFNPKNHEAGTAPQPLEQLPFIVVLIDEFADMMLIVGKKVEELITRLAQKARAAGVHLILATQRPSVDVITGLIKANVPSRIAFQVSSKIDSRTIIDQSGAEQLLGHGDMLYLPPGTAMPERIHGAFVSDEEVHRVVEHLKSQHPRANYFDGVLDEVQLMADGTAIGPTGLPEPQSRDGANDLDALYDQAVRIVTETRRASISGVQRRLKIGYNRAARLIEEMQAQGVVSPPERNGDRTVIAPPPPAD